MADMNSPTPPRIYCLPAADAPVVAVFRRGPTDWSHLGRWDLANDRYEPGAWLRGRIFPRRSDLSPDGRYLCYFAHKPTANWELGEAYVAISRLPWLTALHAFATLGTWTRGYYFSAASDSQAELGSRLPMPYGLQPIPVVQFANERRRGWEETPDSPRRDPKDVWDENRNARLRKRQPGGETWLGMGSLGHAGGDFGIDQAVDGLRVEYWLETETDLQPLEDFQWADWDRDGCLLAATRSGKLQRLCFTSQGLDVRFEADLTALKPDPIPAPDWSRHW